MFQLTLALEKLAHFHALTYSYGKSKGIKNFEEEFDFFNQIFKNFDVRQLQHFFKYYFFFKLVFKK